MSRFSENKNILAQVEKLYSDEEKKLHSSEEWIDFSKSYRAFRRAAFRSALPFDPRFNAVHWGFAVCNLCKEIAFGYCWMNACARYYKRQVEAGNPPGNADFQVSYFADNCITRIDSCRDKVSLMVWAFYCPFNPEKKHETLDYQRVLERIKYPLKFGLSLKDNESFVKYLETLKGEDFDRVEKYRNYKIHRIEPRLEIYGVKSHHGWDYMIPIFDNKEREEWERQLEKEHPNGELRERIKESCHINGVLFDWRKIRNSLWDYDEVSQQIRSSLTKLIKASAGCYRLLTRRAPLRKNQKVLQKIGGISKR